MDAIPSAHLRQQKLEHQRQLIEQKQKQKRQSVGTIKCILMVMKVIYGIINLILIYNKYFQLQFSIKHLQNL